MRELVRNFVTKLKEIIKSFSEATKSEMEEEATKSEMEEEATKSEMEEEATFKEFEDLDEKALKGSTNKLIAYLLFIVVFLLIGNDIFKFSVASSSVKAFYFIMLFMIIPLFFSSLITLKTEIMSIIKIFAAFIILIAMAIGLAILINYAITVNWDPLFSHMSLF